MKNLTPRFTGNNSPLIIRASVFVRLAIACALVMGAAHARAQESARPLVKDKASSGDATQKKADGESNKIVREGIAVEFNVSPVARDGRAAAELIEGEDARVEFKITDTTANRPVTTLRPAAWMDFKHGNQAGDAKGCREKIQSFLQGSLAARPDVDLNSYYVLAMNREPNISVIDPLLGYGSTKLLTLIILNNPGEDWALSRDGKRLFVTVPMSNQVAVVDTATWKVTTYVDAGFRPARIAFQHDEKYAWITAKGISDAQSPGGLIAIDTATLKVVARIATGAGSHEMAFSSDDRFVYATNSDDGTVSVIDVQKLAKIKDVKVGKVASSLAFSALSKAVYAVDEIDGVITVIDSQTHAALARVNLAPGIRVIRFAPNSRWAIVVNSKTNTAQIFDASTNKVAHTFEVGPGPDQISFTTNYAYVRSVASEQVCMFPLMGLDKGGAIQVTRFPGGQVSPDRAGEITGPNAIVPAPEGGSVLIANPADQTIYYYTEGMAAPMGNFQNYRRQPRGLMVVDRSIRETSPGVYSTIIRMPASGSFDMAFLLDSPRVSHCFDVNVKPNLALRNKYPDKKLAVEYLIDDNRIRTGEKVSLRFKLRDPVSSEPKSGLKDVGIVTMLAPGPWHDRQQATSLGDGVYEVSFTPPEPGVYYVFIQCPSLKIKINELPYMILDGRQQPSQSGAKSSTDGKQ